MVDENEEVGTSKSRMRILSHEIRNRKVYCGDLLTRLEEWMGSKLLPSLHENHLEVEDALREWIHAERKTLAALDGGAS